MSVKSKKTRLLAIPVTAGAAFAIATGAFAAGDGASTPTTPVAAQASAPSAEVLQSFSAFRDVPADTSAPTFKIPALKKGAQPPTEKATAVGATTFEDGRSLWLSTSDSTICASFVPKGADTPSGGCSSAEEVAADGATTSAVYSDSDIDFAGIVPDGVTRVTINLHGGKAVPGAVKNNAYAVHADALPSSVEFTTKDGRTVKQDQFSTSSLK